MLDFAEGRDHDSTCDQNSAQQSFAAQETGNAPRLGPVMSAALTTPRHRQPGIDATLVGTHGS